MIKINVPNNNINERKYILDILFNDFLGLTYSLTIGSNNYEIILPNKKELIIEDTFFNKYPKELEYLKLDNIPKSIKELDIFSACFFMLTRWEEYVNKNRDKHNRFPVRESLAYKENFLDRPIVNELLDELKEKLLRLDDSLTFKKREFTLFLTHDVDYIYKWNSYKRIIIHLVGDILLRKSIQSFFSTIIKYINFKFGKGRDPFDTFDYLMNISDKIGVTSYFFFMAKGTSKYDNNYLTSSYEALNLIKKIKKRGHSIGIHPTYNSYNNSEYLKNEKSELERNFDLDILYGREHYLRFDVPNTWQVWEDNEMSWDSTLGYADREGFRCGVCYEYRVFNFLTRKKLKLKEKPLIVMEESVIRREELSSNDMEDIIINLLNQVKKYRGDFVFLWHNSSFNTKSWNKYSKVYENVLFRSMN